MLWKEIGYSLDCYFSTIFKNSAFINPESITWDDKITTNFQGEKVTFSISVELYWISNIISKNVKLSEYLQSVKLD